jgi:hypothetical protein
MNNVIVSNIKTLPTSTRQSMMMKKNRDKSAVVVDRQRSLSRSIADDTKSIDSFDTRSMISEREIINGRSSMQRDKKYRSSFFKKSMSRKHQS